MNISFETEYNQKAMTTMAKALRKTIRKKKATVLTYWDGLL